MSNEIDDSDENKNLPESNAGDKLEKKNKSNTDDKLTFEKALIRLETYVRTLEQGELTLDQSLSIFEDGMKLAKFCSKKLDEAERKIEILIEKDGELIKEDFSVEEENEN